MSTSWVARSRVTPTSRIRAGNGPARRLEMAKTVDSQPASSTRPSSRIAGLNRSMWPTWTGGAPAADAAATSSVGLRRRRGQRLLDEDGDPALDRGQGQRQVAGGRRRDDDRVEVRLGQHGQRLAERWAPDRVLAAARAPGSGSATAASRTPGSAAEHAQVVAAHRPEADQPDPHLALADGRPGAGHRRGSLGRGRGCRGRVGAGQTAARTAAMTVPWSSSDEHRVHRQRQRLLGRPVGHRQVRADPALQDVRLAMDRDRVVDPDATPAAASVRDDPRRDPRRRRRCTGGRRGSGRPA